MKKGMVRRIDELGRIVIPKEMRKRLKMKEGESIAFFIEDDSLILKKYSEIEGISETVESLIRALYERYQNSVFVTNNEKILYCSEDILSTYQKRELSEYYKENVIDSKENESIEIINGEMADHAYIYPFIIEGKMIGSLGILIKKTPYHIIDKQVVKFVIETIEKEILSCV